MIARLRTSHVRPTTHAGHELAAARIRARARVLLDEDCFPVRDDDELDVPIEARVAITASTIEAQHEGENE